MRAGSRYLYFITYIFARLHRASILHMSSPLADGCVLRVYFCKTAGSFYGKESHRDDCMFAWPIMKKTAERPNMGEVVPTCRSFVSESG